MELVMYIMAAVGVIVLYLANCVVLSSSKLLQHERALKARIYTYFQVVAIYGFIMLCVYG